MNKTFQYSALLGLASLLTTSLSAGQEESIQTPAPDRTSGIVGHLGISNGMNFLSEDNGESAREWFGSLDGSITLPAFQADLLIFDIYARFDNIGRDDDFDSNEDPKYEGILGLHYLRQVRENTRAGFFASYGYTIPQDEDSSDAYDVLTVGLEAQHFLSDNTMVYSQLGWGEKIKDGQDDDEAFNGGLVARVGASYFPDNVSSITLDFEAAGTNNYVDNDDAGVFLGATLSYQRPVAETIPLYFTCFGRYDLIDGTDDGNVDEWQLGVGFRYYFGADSPRDAARKGISIGTPRLPTRGSAWTEFLD